MYLYTYPDISHGALPDLFARRLPPAPSGAQHLWLQPPKPLCPHACWQALLYQPQAEHPLRFTLLPNAHPLAQQIAKAQSFPLLQSQGGRGLITDETNGWVICSERNILYGFRLAARLLAVHLLADRGMEALQQQLPQLTQPYAGELAPVLHDLQVVCVQDAYMLQASWPMLTLTLPCLALGSQLIDRDILLETWVLPQATPTSRYAVVCKGAVSGILQVFPDIPYPEILPHWHMLLENLYWEKYRQETLGTDYTLFFNF